MGQVLREGRGSFINQAGGKRILVNIDTKSYYLQEESGKGEKP